MGLSLKSLAAEMQPFHNDVCIVHDCVIGRLVGVAEDDQDLYYMVVSLEHGLAYYSAVGFCVSLRETYPAKDYARLDSILAMNNAGKTEVFETRVLPSSNRKECYPSAFDGPTV